MDLSTLRAVVNELPVILFALDADGRFLLSEGGGLAALGLEPGQVVGLSVFDLYRDVDPIAKDIRRALAGEDAVVSTSEVAGLIYESTYVPVRDPSGAVTGVLGLALDVTERVRAERERERLIDQLHRALELRNEFLSIASHELRTPLTALSLKLELLHRRARLAGPEMPSEEVATQTERLIRLAGRLERLVGELLDVSRIARGKLRLELEPLDLAELLREVAERMRVPFERADRPLLVRSDRSVPARADRTRVEQILENLLSNALRHGEGPVEVTLAADSTRATLAVHDHGPGIPAEELENVFERFARLAPRGLGGLGLGLYICRQIVEAHGGTVRVHSAPGEGTTFRVMLPLRPPETAS
jgi:PAS domain S-box-containing protein